MHVEDRLSADKGGNKPLGSCCNDPGEKDSQDQESSSEILMREESQEDEESQGWLQFLA